MEKDGTNISIDISAEIYKIKKPIPNEMQHLVQTKKIDSANAI